MTESQNMLDAIRYQALKQYGCVVDYKEGMACRLVAHPRGRESHLVIYATTLDEAVDRLILKLSKEVHDER